MESEGDYIFLHLYLFAFSNDIYLLYYILPIGTSFTFLISRSPKQPKTRRSPRLNKGLADLCSSDSEEEVEVENVEKELSIQQVVESEIADYFSKAMDKKYKKINADEVIIYIIIFKLKNN